MFDIYAVQTQFQKLKDMEADSEEVWVNEMDTGDPLYRVKEKEMKDIPHRLIGFLLCRAKKRGTLIKGTAILISPDLALTCSHNLYDREYSEEYFNFRFYPGHFGVLDSGYEVESIFVPPEYKQKKHPNLSQSKFDSCRYQYGLLKLKKPINDSSFIPLRTIKQKESVKKLIVFGYPGRTYKPVDKSGERYEIFQQGIEKERGLVNIDLKKEQIQHNISTFQGQSGSPILALDKNNELSVLGIHKGGITQQNGKQVAFNGGRLMTIEVIAQLYKKAVQWRAEMFYVQRPSLSQLKLKWYQPLELRFNVSNQDMSKVPHNLIGVLLRKKIIEGGTGTGILLSPNVVLTSAAAIYNLKQKKFDSNLSFCLGHVEKCQKDHFEISDFYVPEEYKNGKSSPKYNYGLLKLKNKVERHTFLPVTVETKFENLSTQLAAFGYTRSTQIGVFGNNCVKYIKKRFFHRLSTQPGMIGCPLLTIDKYGRIAFIGIHQGQCRITVDGQQQVLKHGTLFRQEMLTDMKKWIEKMKTEMYLISN